MDAKCDAIERPAVRIIVYDPAADAAYITLADEPVAQVRELSDVCVLDLSADGRVVGIELLSVFGFADAALADLSSKSLIDRKTADAILGDLRLKSRAA